jgi:hypothetical protein
MLSYCLHQHTKRSTNTASSHGGGFGEQNAPLLRERFSFGTSDLAMTVRVFPQTH